MIAFSHIPKTAGTTLNNILRRNLGWNLISLIPKQGITYLYKDMRRDSILFSEKICLTGHGLKPFVDFHEFESQLCWFTFVRNPINRLVSLYVHQFSGNYERYKIPFDKWLKKYDRRNLMVRLIAGKQDLSLAMNMLHEKFRFIGVTEKFDESLVLMKQIVFENNINIQYSTVSMSSKNTDIAAGILDTPEFVELINDQNRLDLELYKFVTTQVFPNQIETLGLRAFNDGMCVFQEEQKKSKISSSNNNLIKYQIFNKGFYKPFVYLHKAIG